MLKRAEAVVSQNAKVCQVFPRGAWICLDLRQKKPGFSRGSLGGVNRVILFVR